jgi:large subunit ribosomal protein L9
LKKTTEVMLTQPIDNLGDPGDVVTVAPGYARNYLLPRGLAVPPTQHNQERFRKAREAHLVELRNREEQAKALQQQLNGYALTFHRKSHEEGKLYSSVRPEEIVARLSEELGAEIERGKVQLSAPIETLGHHLVKINLYKEISAEIRVEVLEEEEAASHTPSHKARASA